jgi:hypothetical protein
MKKPLVVCRSSQRVQIIEMKDLDTLDQLFLSLEIFSYSDGYYLTHAKYNSNLLSQIGLTNNMIVDTLIIEPNVCLNPFDGEPHHDSTLYL